MTSSTFSAPIENRYFEDYKAGSVHEFGELTVTQDEIIAFAKEFDPQLFHTDPEAAKETIYGGLIASGWHTSGMMMRLYSDHYLSKNASLGSPGVDALRWLKPVRAGDRLSIRVTISETRRSTSKPDRGLVHSFIEVLNQDRQVVMSMKAVNFLLCRQNL
ncbi:Acyl dehydratase [Olavius algarvensis associated proteobacterium Delta 3]|nr:Acyl dehydratase [Olavius algarvensis associated proteobacterium Delta 3]CAB5126801.1 Acyl dehydratase [Olavius algarvensis associated proteobacterium Delta 3]